LRYGYTAFRRVDSGHHGIIAFSRLDQGREMLVILNNANHPLALGQVPIGDNRPSQRYRNLLNGYEFGLTTGEGTVDFGHLSIAAKSAMILVDDRHFGPYSAYLNAHQCKDNPQLVPSSAEGR
jgi:hypothetical protein